MIQVKKKLDSGTRQFLAFIFSVVIKFYFIYFIKGWAYGEIQVKGSKIKQSGYYPESFTKPIGKQSATSDSSSTAPKSPSLGKSEEKVEKVITLYPYQANQDDELTFEGLFFS